jgi:hypothetical protein
MWRGEEEMGLREEREGERSGGEDREREEEWGRG